MSEPLYRIRDWNHHFENNRTRELKKLDWVPVPNKHDGDGFTELLDHPNGMLHYAAWHLILQVASKCTPRGTLVREIPQAGAGCCQTPHTPTSLARITHGEKTAFEEAIPRLLSIGWIEVCKESRHNPAPACGKVPMEWNGMEWNGREGNGSEVKCSERVITPPLNTPPATTPNTGDTTHTDFSTLPGMVKAICNCRPEYARCLKPVSVENALKACPAEHRGKLPEAVREWCEDHSNRATAFDGPLNSVKAIVRKLVSGDTHGKRKSIDQQQLEDARARWEREDADRKAKGECA